MVQSGSYVLSTPVVTATIRATVLHLEARNYQNDLFTWSKVMGPIYPFYARNADGSVEPKDNGEAIYDYGNGQSGMPSIAEAAVLTGPVITR